MKAVRCALLTSPSSFMAPVMQGWGSNKWTRKVKEGWLQSPFGLGAAVLLSHCVAQRTHHCRCWQRTRRAAALEHSHDCFCFPLHLGWANTSGAVSRQTPAQKLLEADGAARQSRVLQGSGESAAGGWVKQWGALKIYQGRGTHG